MTVNELLLSLNDIQAPVEPGWWPLAMGWWLILVIFLVVIGFSWWFIRQRRFNRIAIQAARELKLIERQFKLDGDPLQLKLSMSRWVKQVSLIAFPDAGIDGYCGQRWVDFLDQKSEGLFASESMGRIFRDEIYSGHNDFDCDALIRFCRLWLLRINVQLLAAKRP